METWTEESIQNDLITILKDMTSDWDIDQFSGGINADTKLVGDLSFESIELVQLMVAIEQHFGLKNLASEKLLVRDGKYVSDLTVAEIARFLHGEIKAR
jgi:acyl carrier protein